MEKLIYVCTPYRASTTEELTENVELAKRVCQRVLSENDVPVAPHLFFPQLSVTRKVGTEAGLKLLEKCDAVYVCGSRISQGMAAEIENAIKLGIPVKCVADPKFAEKRLLRKIMKKGDCEHE